MYKGTRYMGTLFLFVTLFSVFTGLANAASGAVSQNDDGTFHYKNWAGNLHFDFPRYFEPSSIDEVQDIVRNSMRVRVVGTSHAANPQVKSDDTIISLTKLRGIVSCCNDGIITVEAGVSFHDINTVIENAGYALESLPCTPEISVLGSILTSSHGAGVTAPALPALVHDVTVVKADGSLHTYTRADSEFPYVVVSMGVLGVVVQYSLILVPSYDIKQYVYEDIPFDSFVSPYYSPYQYFYATKNNISSFTPPRVSLSDTTLPFSSPSFSRLSTQPSTLTRTPLTALQAQSNLERVLSLGYSVSLFTVFEGAGARMQATRQADSQGYDLYTTPLGEEMGMSRENSDFPEKYAAFLPDSGSYSHQTFRHGFVNVDNTCPYIHYGLSLLLSNDKTNNHVDNRILQTMMRYNKTYASSSSTFSYPHAEMCASLFSSRSHPRSLSMRQRQQQQHHTQRNMATTQRSKHTQRQLKTRRECETTYKNSYRKKYKPSQNLNIPIEKPLENSSPSGDTQIPEFSPFSECQLRRLAHVGPRMNLLTDPVMVNILNPDCFSSVHECNAKEEDNTQKQMARYSRQFRTHSSSSPSSSLDTMQSLLKQLRASHTSALSSTLAPTAQARDGTPSNPSSSSTSTGSSLASRSSSSSLAPASTSTSASTGGATLSEVTLGTASAGMGVAVNTKEDMDVAVGVGVDDDVDVGMIAATRAVLAYHRASEQISSDNDGDDDVKAHALTTTATAATAAAALAAEEEEDVRVRDMLREVSQMRLQELLDNIPRVLSELAAKRAEREEMNGEDGESNGKEREKTKEDAEKEEEELFSNAHYYLNHEEHEEIYEQPIHDISNHNYHLHGYRYKNFMNIANNKLTSGNSPPSRELYSKNPYFRDAWVPNTMYPDTLSSQREELDIHSYVQANGKYIRRIFHSSNSGFGIMPDVHDMVASSLWIKEYIGKNVSENVSDKVLIPGDDDHFDILHRWGARRSLPIWGKPKNKTNSQIQEFPSTPIIPGRPSLNGNPFSRAAWLHRLPHFSPGFDDQSTHGDYDELQTEYSIPMIHASAVLSEIIYHPELQIIPKLLHISEIRMIRADSNPLSLCYDPLIEIEERLSRKIKNSGKPENSAQETPGDVSGMSAFTPKPSLPTNAVPLPSSYATPFSSVSSSPASPESSFPLPGMGDRHHILYTPLPAHAHAHITHQRKHTPSSNTKTTTTATTGSSLASNRTISPSTLSQHTDDPNTYPYPLGYSPRRGCLQLQFTWRRSKMQELALVLPHIEDIVFRHRGRPHWGKFNAMTADMRRAVFALADLGIFPQYMEEEEQGQDQQDKKNVELRNNNQKRRVSDALKQWIDVDLWYEWEKEGQQGREYILNLIQKKYNLDGIPEDWDEELLASPSYDPLITLGKLATLMDPSGKFMPENLASLLEIESSGENQENSHIPLSLDRNPWAYTGEAAAYSSALLSLGINVTATPATTATTNTTTAAATVGGNNRGKKVIGWNNDGVNFPIGIAHILQAHAPPVPTNGENNDATNGGNVNNQPHSKGDLKIQNLGDSSGNMNNSEVVVDNSEDGVVEVEEDNENVDIVDSNDANGDGDETGVEDESKEENNTGEEQENVPVDDASAQDEQEGEVEEGESEEEKQDGNDGENEGNEGEDDSNDEVTADSEDNDTNVVGEEEEEPEEEMEMHTNEEEEDTENTSSETSQPEIPENARASSPASLDGDVLVEVASLDDTELEPYEEIEGGFNGNVILPPTYTRTGPHTDVNTRSDEDALSSAEIYTYAETDADTGTDITASTPVDRMREKPEMPKLKDEL